tara:strand:- start:850 stop:1371 length:522 start_codon:yes stop_codon:yes gene_type:complete
MKLKTLLLEAEAEADIESALKTITTDLAKADIDNDNTNEAIGLTLAGVALSGGEIIKYIGKFINLLSKIPFLKKLSGDKLIKFGEKYHHVIVEAIEKILMKAGVKDKEKARKFANGIHMLVVAALLFSGLGAMATKASSGQYTAAALKGALNAVKTGEISSYVTTLATTISKL